MFEFMKDVGNYNTRKIGRDTVDGVDISTAYTSDEGYETAILDKSGVHPVERYTSKDEALAGHEKWKHRVVGLDKINLEGLVV